MQEETDIINQRPKFASLFENFVDANSMGEERVSKIEELVTKLDVLDKNLPEPGPQPQPQSVFDHFDIQASRVHKLNIRLEVIHNHLRNLIGAESD